MVPQLPKLGLIAGGGAIPAIARDTCRAVRRPLYIAALNGFCDPATVEGTEHGWFDLPQVGRLLKALKAADVEDVCLCGRVKKPNFSALKPDLRGALLLPRIIKAATTGDDAILRVVVEAFEQDGFRVIGIEQVVGKLLVSEKQYGSLAPNPMQQADVRMGIAAARELGRADRGQAVIVAAGSVIDREDDGGTDALLARVAGRAEARGGVLVKTAKPQQDRRVDLPTVGMTTIAEAAAAGLAGIAVEAGAALIVDAEAMAAAADRHGMFLIGFRHDES
jgi:UDP-2,3-diacylglucosamine hydrolase